MSLPCNASVVVLRTPFNYVELGLAWTLHTRDLLMGLFNVFFVFFFFELGVLGALRFLMLVLLFISGKRRDCVPMRQPKLQKVSFGTNLYFCRGCCAMDESRLRPTPALELELETELPPGQAVTTWRRGSSCLAASAT